MRRTWSRPIFTFVIVYDTLPRNQRRNNNRFNGRRERYPERPASRNICEINRATTRHGQRDSSSVLDVTFVLTDVRTLQWLGVSRTYGCSIRRRNGRRGNVSYKTVIHTRTWFFYENTSVPIAPAILRPTNVARRFISILFTRTMRVLIVYVTRWRGLAGGEGLYVDSFETRRLWAA